METKYLQSALAVAEHGSFTLAAQRLFLAQSTVTRQVQAVEREVGRPLFVRQADGVHVTREGRVFLEAVQHVLAAERAALDGARSVSAVQG